MSFADLTEKISAERDKLLNEIAILKYESMNDSNVDNIDQIGASQTVLDILTDLYDKCINEQGDIHFLYLETMKYIQAKVKIQSEEPRYTDKPVAEDEKSAKRKPKIRSQKDIARSDAVASSSVVASAAISRAENAESAEKSTDIKGYKLRAFDIKVKGKDGNTTDIIPGIYLPPDIAPDKKYSATVDSIVLTFKFNQDRKIKPEDRATALHLLRDAEKLQKPVTKAILHLDQTSDKEYGEVYDMISKKIKRIVVLKPQV